MSGVRFLPTGYGKRKFVWLFPAFMLMNTFFFYDKVTSNNEKSISNDYSTLNHSAGGRSLLETNPGGRVDCIPHSITDFPGDFFTQDQRLYQGGVVIHLLIAFYLFSILAIVCDDFFVPSLETITDVLKVPTDVAGATFMAIGTSSPELFQSLIGSFLTEGDTGIATIVGSAVFNILGVTSITGLAVWRNNVAIDWYPISRDCTVYTLTVLALILVIYDNLVLWWEALVLVLMFFAYIIIMYFNSSIERFCQDKMSRIRGRGGYVAPDGENHKKSLPDEKTPLTWSQESDSQPIVFNSQISFDNGGVKVESREFTNKHKDGDYSYQEATLPLPKPVEDEPDEDTTTNLCEMPMDSAAKQIYWVLMWPASLLLFLTIPNCRKYPKLFPITFIMSVVWIAGVSYLCVWMVTIIAYTLYIPDAVAGITILAIGTSVPEVISSVIVVRNGLGNMAICNLIGSNIFDILFCLGAPWMIKTLGFSETGSIVINSSAMTYTVITLLATVVSLYIIFIASGWQLNFKVGFICLFVYLAFITMSCLYELNVFGDINAPPCPRFD